MFNVILGILDFISDDGYVIFRIELHGVALGGTN